MTYCVLNQYIIEVFRFGSAKPKCTEQFNTDSKIAFFSNDEIRSEKSQLKVVRNEYSSAVELWHFENVSLSPHIKPDRALSLKMKLS